MSVVNFKIKASLFISCLAFTVVGFSQVETFYSVPVTEFGHPDLQGVWTDQSMTPLERPDSLLFHSSKEFGCCAWFASNYQDEMVFGCLALIGL